MNTTSKLKSTDTGYINSNNQCNNGKTEKPGIDNMQWFYDYSDILYKYLIYC